MLSFSFGGAAAGAEGAEGAAGAAGLGMGAGESAREAGAEGVCTGSGFEPPMFSEIVGAGAGASVCAGRSTGASGGCAGCAGCAGTRKAWPGTKENAFALSLLIATAILVRYRWTSEVVVRNARETGRDMGTNEPDGSREQGGTRAVTFYRKRAATNSASD